MTSDDRTLLILYGSQTGTAQEFAEQIWREAKKMHWHGPVRAMDEIEPIELLQQKVCIFVCATTGQGEEPDNMKAFWRFLLLKSLPPTSLVDLNFAVLGLGDSSYAKFNFVAKRLHKRLAQLGGKEMVPAGLADDQHDLGPDAVASPWTKSVWNKLEEMYPTSNLISDSTVVPQRYKFSIFKKDTPCDASVDISKTSTNQSDVMTATLQENVRTTSADHYQDVRLLKLSVPGIKYNPGDILMVQPKNSPENVNRLLKMFNLCGDDVILLQTTDDKFPISLPPQWMCANPCTVFECVRNLLDLQVIPQRYCLQLMAHFTTSDLERERLLEFCSPEGQQDLVSYCHRPKRSTLEILEDFPHALAAIPVEFLFDLFKIIRPRAFSIASALELHADQVELLVAVVKYKTLLKAPRLGLCSNWMASLQPASQLSVWVKSGTFTFPDSPEIPVIFVGPGTGCAPFRSFVQRRAALHSTVRGKIAFFFGCRKELGDFHCAEEWRQYADKGIIDIFTAFSQDQPDKVYVQHKIEEQSKMLWSLLHHSGAYFYIAGNAINMPKSVRDAIVEIAEREGALSKEDAEMFVSNLEKTERYQSETWA